MARKVAFIGTGGTIASIGKGPLDLIDYVANNTVVHAEDIVTAVPSVREVADLVVVKFRDIPSTRDLVSRMETTRRAPPSAGRGDPRPRRDRDRPRHRVSGRERVFPQPHAQGAGGDRGLAAPAERPGKRRGDEPGGRGPGRGQPRLGGAGGFVVLNDKIQAAREATKTSTFRLQTFRTPDFGVLGSVDGEHVRYYRRTERRNAPDTEFDIAPLDSLPRVDISYSYAGADGTAIRAFTSVGAKGIVLAAFAPGMVTPGEQEAIKAAVEAGVTVVVSTRAGSGVALDSARLRPVGVLSADNLNPQKARLLLALALTVTREPDEIRRIFATY